jgi:uncharacterized membrane protein YozB (DUF420 family)
MSFVWPTLNAGFNLISFLCLLAGYWFIRKGERERHRSCMLGALLASCFFLASYLAYHFNVGSTTYQATGVKRTFYLMVLISHSVLAAGVAPLVVMTVVRALGGSYEKHRAVARWTLPIWLYVSCTGVVVYLMLYVLPK